MNSQASKRFAHPRLRAIADRGARVADLVFERLAANAMDPNAYPLPRSPESAERMLKKVIDELSAAKRNAIYERARQGLRESATARRLRLGDLARLNLRSGTAIAEQLAGLAPPTSVRIPQREIKQIVDSIIKFPFPGLNEPTAAVSATKLDIHITQVECFLQTFKERGGDEICATVVLLNEKGEISNSNAVDLGSYVDNRVRAFAGPGLALHTLDVSSGTFPKALAFFPVMVERDHAGLASALVLIAAAIGIAGGAGMVVGTATANPVVILIGLAAMLLGVLLDILAWLALDTCITTSDLAGVLVESAQEAPGVLDTSTFTMSEQENFFGNARGIYALTTVASLRA
jgi:hypothetical protein